MRKKKAGIISISIILAAALIIGYTYFHKKSSKVWVDGVSQHEKFKININNEEIVTNGYIYSFRSKLTKEELLAEISKNYPNYKEEDGSIIVFDNNEYFIIDVLAQGITSSYKVYGDYIKFYDEENDVSFNIPFPEESVWYKQYVKRKFSTTYSFEELKEYYAPFTNVTIKSNTITIDGDVKVTLTYNDEKRKVHIKNYVLK